jgi:pyridoxine/pyridoxamine 5'-phosphate oxidase
MSEREPLAARPRFPQGYGISSGDEGMLPWSWADERLGSSRTYWVATTRPNGAPHSVPVSGLWFGAAVVFSTSRESRKARNLERDPRAVVHLGSAEEVVILEGEVEQIEIDAPLADAYEAKYEFRPEVGPQAGLWYRLPPRVAYAWLEQDYPRTATRFAFDR